LQPREIEPWRESIRRSLDTLSFERAAAQKAASFAISMEGSIYSLFARFHNETNLRSLSACIALDQRSLFSCGHHAKT
jgi:hypothetical protein